MTVALPTAAAHLPSDTLVAEDDVGLIAIEFYGGGREGGQ